MIIKSCNNTLNEHRIFIGETGRPCTGRADKLLKVGTRIQSELACRTEVGKASRSSNMTSGHRRNQTYGRERYEKNLGDNESGASADAMGGGGGSLGRLKGSTGRCEKKKP
jgi:hypothetical protein